MQTVRQWLEQLGLSQYAEVFEGNQLNLDLAKDLTDQDLRELGVAALGHRKVLLRAIAALPIPQSQSLAGTHASALDQTSPPEGERRQLTVLFCDLVGSTELSRQLDPEDLQRLIVRYQEVCATAIRRFDGFVAQFLGDGVLAYFGYPTAHEGEAERAILAGLAALEAVIGLEHAAPIRLRARAGVATGVVVVGQIAAGTALEKAAIGEAPNTAARLQGLAAPGSLLIDERTRELAAGAFDYEDLGKHALKGRPEPVRVFRVVGQSRAQSRFEAATSGSFAPMVGRELECGVLLHAWERTRLGKGHAVLLCGEPGIGKSRLLLALRARLEPEGVGFLQYHCSPYFTNSALYPIIEYWQRALDFRRDESSSSRLDKLEAFMLAECQRPREDLNLLARLLSLPAEDRFGPLRMMPQKQKDETLRALVDILATTARRNPSVVLFEDIHWADPTTVAAWAALIGGLDHIPVLVVMTYRPELRPQWLGQAGVTSLILSRLDPEQTAAVVEGVTKGKDLPPDIVDQIVAKTDGVPLFVEELTKTLIESGLLKQAGDRYEVSAPSTAFAIPATLRDSLMARLDRLGSLREIAQTRLYRPRVQLRVACPGFTIVRVRPRRRIESTCRLGAGIPAWKCSQRHIRIQARAGSGRSL